MASLLDTITSAVKKVWGKIKTEAWIFKEAVQDTYSWKNISDITNKAVSDFATSWKKVWEYVGWKIDTWLGIQSDFKWTLGKVWETLTSVPKTITEWLKSGIESSAEAIGSFRWWDVTKWVAKSLKTVVDPALSLISSTPVPLFVQWGMKVLWVDQKATQGVEFLKGWLSETLNNFWIDKDTADELGSTLIDSAQTLLSIKWWKVSSQAGGKAKVQSISDIARQGEILKAIEKKAAARPGATQASILASVEKAKPLVSQAKASPVSWGDVAKYNLQKIWFDVAANTALPVLGIAMQSVRDGDYNSLNDALTAFASNAAPSLATAIPGFKGVKALKTKPSEAQLNLDADIATEKWWITKAEYGTLKTDIQKTEAKKAKEKAESDKVIAETNVISTGRAKSETPTAAIPNTPVKIEWPRDINNLLTKARKLEKESFGKNPKLALEKMLQAKSLYDEVWSNNYDPRDYESVLRVIDTYKNKLWIDATAKSETPTIAIPKETPVAPVKEVTTPVAKSESAPMLNAEPAVAAIKKAKKITKKGEAPAPSDSNAIFMQKYRDTNKQIADKNAEQAYLESRAEEFVAMNAKQDQKSQEFAAKQEAKWQKLADIVMWKILKWTDESMARRQEAVDLQAIRDAETQAFADILNAEQKPEFFTEFMKTNPTVEQATVANDMRNKMDQWESAANIMRSTLLSRAQKEAIVKDYQAWLTGSRTTPKTLAETVAEATQKTQAEDLDFITPGADTFSTKMDQIETVEPTGYRVKAGAGRIAAETGKQVSDKAALNNIEVVLPDGKVVDAGNHIVTSENNIRGSVKETAQESTGLTRENLSTLLNFKKKVDKNDLIGKTTDYYGTEITPENVDAFMKATFDNADGLEWKVEWFRKGEFSNAVRASALYSFIKNDPKLLAKYFTPEQIATLSKFDKESVMASQEMMSTKQLSDGLLTKSMLNPDYMRLVMTQENYDNIPKQAKAKIVMDIGNGETRTFDNPIEAESFVRIEMSRGKNITPDMAKYSSLTKEQAGWLYDPYRIHGGIASMASYIDAMADTYAKVNTAKILKDIAWNKDVSQYSENIRANVFGNNLEQRVLGLDTIWQSEWQKALNALGWIGSASKLFGSASTYGKAWVTSWLKTLKDVATSAIINAAKWRFQAAMRDVWEGILSLPGTITWFGRTNVGGRFADLIGTGDQWREVQTVLGREWFVEGYGVWESLGQWAFWKWVAISSGIRQENAAKTWLALRSMRRNLLDNGYKVTDTKSIIDAWNQFKQEKPVEYTYARNNIYNEAQFLGSTNRLDKAGFLGLQRVLWPIKTFNTWLVATTLDDARTIYSEVKKGLTAKGIDPVRLGKAGERLVSNMVAPVLIYWAIYEMLPDDMDDKLKDKIAKTWQENTWNTNVESVVNWVKGLPDAIGIDVAMEVIDATANQYDIATADRPWSTKWKIMLGKWIDDIRRIFAWVNTINRLSALSGKSLQETITDAIGTTNLEDATKYWVATWVSTDSTLEAIWNLFGFPIDTPINALLRKPESVLSQDEADIKRWILDFMNVARVFKDADIPYSYSNSAFLTAGWDIKERLFGEKDATKKTPEQILLEKQDVYDVITNLDTDKKKPFNELLLDMNVDPRLTTVIKSNIDAYLWKIAKQNNNVEETFRFDYDPRRLTEDGYFQTVINDMRLKNPRAYNDTVSFLSEIAWVAKTFDYSQLKQSKSGTWEFADKQADAYFKDLLAKYNESSDVQNQAIADYWNEKSLTTSAVNQAFKVLNDIDVQKLTQQELQDKVQLVNDYLSFIEKNANYTGNHTDAASLQSFETAKKLVESAKLGKFISKMPMLELFVKRALSLRWEDVPEEWWQTISSIVQKTWTWKWNWYTSDISLPELTWWIIPDKKKQKEFELPSGWKASKVWWVWAQKSLAELLNTPQMRQAMSRWWQLQTREPLATFSKSLNPTRV